MHGLEASGWSKAAQEFCLSPARQWTRLVCTPAPQGSEHCRRGGGGGGSGDGGGGGFGRGSDILS